jgi:hypothetical protein
MKKKNPASVSLGILGVAARNRSFSPEERVNSSRKAGNARMQTMTPEQRRVVAEAAAKARCAKKERRNG